MQFAWWHWIIGGFCLIGLELMVPSFTIIWFGLGALVVGALKALWPAFSLAGQLFLWTVASTSFTVMWFKYLKPKANSTHAWQSKEAIVGETGIIIQRTGDSYGRGTVRLRIAVLGADQWSCYADEVLEVGDSVRVVDIEGQILKVIKMQRSRSGGTDRPGH